MNLSNLKQSSYSSVEKYLKEELKLNDYQYLKMIENEILKSSDFYFFEHKKKQSNILIRLTIFLLPIVFLLLFMYLPINYIIKGIWGYNHEKLKWYHTWCNKIGL